jgi:hypothetical protein
VDAVLDTTYRSTYGSSIFVVQQLHSSLSRESREAESREALFADNNRIVIRRLFDTKRYRMRHQSSEHRCLPVLDESRLYCAKGCT